MPILTPAALQQRLIFWAIFLLLLLVSNASFITSLRHVTLSANAERSQDAILELERFMTPVRKRED